jgi:hypothetical protein
VAFHCDYLQHSLAPLPARVRRLVQTLWRFVFRCVCLVVMYDHRSVLHEVGVTPRDFWRDCGAIFDEDTARIFDPDLVPASHIELRD